MTSPSAAGSPTQATAPPSPRRRGMGSVANMLRSMLVVLGLVAVLIFLVPRQNAVTQPPVDVTDAAQQVVHDTGWPIVAPVGLPAGWRATSVRYVRSTDGLMTWHVGYQSPQGDYVAVEQTRGATSLWVSAQTNRGHPDGTLSAAGRTWQKINRVDKVQRSLVIRGAGPQDLTTIVTGTAPYAGLATFADTLRPVARTG